MTFTLHEPGFSDVISVVDGATPDVSAKIGTVLTDVDDVRQACRHAGLQAAVEQFHDGTLDKAARALKSSSQEVIDAGRQVSQAYQDFDAEVAARASAAEWGR